jgi:hypothetical protein
LIKGKVLKGELFVLKEFLQEKQLAFKKFGLVVVLNIP